MKGELWREHRDIGKEIGRGTGEHQGSDTEMVILQFNEHSYAHKAVPAFMLLPVTQAEIMHHCYAELASVLERFTWLGLNPEQLELAFAEALRDTQPEPALANGGQ